MDGLIVLLVLLALAFPIASIVALVLSLGAKDRLAAIEMRLNALEAAARQGAGGVAPSPVRDAGSRLADQPGTDGSVAAAPALQPQPTAAADATAVSSAPVQADAPIPPPSSSVPPVSRIISPDLPPSPSPSLEERFGTRWVVWAGGLALALGGIFMVRYSIEQGLIGPGVRIALGALLGAALIGAGEWLRRREDLADVAGLPSAPIPSILTAAGTTVCYATVFAAYALYGFIGPAAAFVLLGAVALATLGAALLHGPALAALGLVGAEAAPLLVATDQPNYWALYVYITVVTAAAFALARLRLWRWLAVTALASGVAWGVPSLAVVVHGVPAAGLDPAPLVFHATAGFGLAALFIVGGLFLGPPTVPGRVDALSSAALAAYLFLAAWLVPVASFDMAGLAPFALLLAAAVVIAWRTAAAAAVLPAGAVLATLVMLTWGVLPELTHLVAPGAGPDPSQSDLALHFAFGGFFAGLFGIAGYLAQGRYATAEVPLIWSTLAVLTPLAILVALYAKVQGLEPSVLFAALAVALAAWFATASEWLVKREPRPGVPAAAALHAAGSAAALALALTFALEKGWLTVGLALMAPAIGWVAGKRPLPLLRWIAAAMAVLTVARVAWEPRIVGDDLGTAPLFNWLLYGYGVPALAFWSAGFLLRRRADDVPSRMLDSAAILFTVLFAVLEIRHFMTGGDIYAAHGGLDEIAVQLCACLAVAIGLERLRQRTGNIVHNAGALIVATIALLLIIGVLIGDDNPRLSGLSVSGMFFNRILLAYGLPAGLAITLALITRSTRPMAYRMVAAGASVVLALAYLTLEVMRAFHGPELTGAISDAEGYTFSAVWLAFGVVLLFIALPLDSKPTRLASAAVVVLTTAKVFIVDLGHLDGIWRALSFIGLGLVLVGIGYLYQRLLFPPRLAAASKN